VLRKLMLAGIFTVSAREFRRNHRLAILDWAQSRDILWQLLIAARSCGHHGLTVISSSTFHHVRIREKDRTLQEIDSIATPFDQICFCEDDWVYLSADPDSAVIAATKEIFDEVLRMSRMQFLEDMVRANRFVAFDDLLASVERFNDLSSGKA
jgi:hypothetical protein